MIPGRDEGVFFSSYFASVALSPGGKRRKAKACECGSELARRIRIRARKSDWRRRETHLLRERLGDRLRKKKEEGCRIFSLPPFEVSGRRGRRRENGECRQVAG